jgi:LmbE family N-acetylglucosaminyl deacetylase
VRELWLMAAPDERIDHVVDITDTVGRKVAALRAHASQTTHMTDLDQRIRSLGGVWAHRFGLTAGRLAEAFQIVLID